MAAHQPSAIAMFITQRVAGKPYFIDPQTHAFQHDIEFLESNSKKSESEGKIKRSIQKILDRYGEPLKSQIEEKFSILPEDFNDAKTRREFCERVISFQLEIISDEVKISDAAPYYQFLQEEGVADFNLFGPNMVVAPYFFMDSVTFEDWLKVNIDCAIDSIHVAREKTTPLGVQIVLSRDILFDREQVERLISEYSAIKPDVFLVWIDSFEEQSASASLLKALVDFLIRLKKTGVPVVNLYGGYFSVLLFHKDILDGVTHSLEYGEQRAVVPVGGGIPVAKYYLPCLHTRMRARDAYRAILALGGLESDTLFFENICDCPQCKKVIKYPETDFLEQYGKMKTSKGRSYALPQTKDNSTRHYMWCKQQEFDSAIGVEDRIQALKDTCDNIDLKRAVGIEYTAHCEKWVQVLKGL
jgi:hypothetical protein